MDEFAADREVRVECLASPDAVLASVNRRFPSCVVLDDTDPGSIELCSILKSEPFTAIVPVLFVVTDAPHEAVIRALEAGADDVLAEPMETRERRLRLVKTVERSDRDVSVHPTTRLPGTVLIARDIAERVYSGERFAVCYADLDHFKEFNDCYGYDQGDRIITMISRVLRDVVKAHAPTGFIGHIGGDDFIFNVPLERMRVCCEEILEIVDELLPLQYTEPDRSRGYIVARDRRGNIHEIPLMSLSIGVVTNERRTFTHPAQVSALATEMKSYAKTLSGSVYAVDRRSDDPHPLASLQAPSTTEETLPT